MNNSWREFGQTQCCVCLAVASAGKREKGSDTTLKENTGADMPSGPHIRQLDVFLQDLVRDKLLLAPS